MSIFRMNNKVVIHCIVQVTFPFLSLSVAFLSDRLKGFNPASVIFAWLRQHLAQHIPNTAGYINGMDIKTQFLWSLLEREGQNADSVSGGSRHLHGGLRPVLSHLLVPSTINQSPTESVSSLSEVLGPSSSHCPNVDYSTLVPEPPELVPEPFQLGSSCLVGSHWVSWSNPCSYRFGVSPIHLQGPLPRASSPRHAEWPQTVLSSSVPVVYERVPAVYSGSGLSSHFGELDISISVCALP